MKKLIAYIILALLALPAFAQNERNNWHFAGNTLIHFTPNAPELLNDAPSGPNYIPSGISDINGKLLFYHDATNIYNGLGIIIKANAFRNLTIGGAHTEATIAIPNPANANEYYLFYQSDSSGFGRLISYYVLDGASQTVKSGPTFLSYNAIFNWGSNHEPFLGYKCKLTNAYWLITSSRDSLYAFQITPIGVSTVPVKSAIKPERINISITTFAIHSCSGTMAFHALDYNQTPGQYKIIFNRFNEITGLLGIPAYINDRQNFSSKGCFSPSGRKYYSPAGRGTNMPIELRQYDLSLYDSLSITQSLRLAFFDTIRAKTYLLDWFDMELGPDGKIYIQKDFNNDYLGVINNPEADGMACDFKDSGFSLGNMGWGYRLPNIVTRYGTCGSFEYQINCDSALFHIDTTTLHSSVSWDFSDTLNPVGGIGDTVIHQFKRDGIYTVRMVSTYGSFADTSYKNVQIQHVVYYLPLQDTVLCPGDSVQLFYRTDTSIRYFNWSTGAVTDTITINQSGSYTVVLSNDYCSAYDTINVSQRPYPIIDLGRDTTICYNDTLLLGRLQDTLTYSWNTGEDTSFIRVNDPGEYWVQVSNSTCSTRDTIMISYHPLPTVSGPGEVSACFERGDTVTITSRISGGSYLWDNGNTGQSITANTARTYYVQVTDQYGCVYQDSIIATNNCPAALYYPNAFTPNNDGFNDVFQVKGGGVMSYQLLIFNRWGEKVFESHDINTSWDGYYKGDICQDGVYWGLLKYQFAGRVPEDVKIIIHLIR